MPGDATREHGHGWISSFTVIGALPTRPAPQSMVAGPARHPADSIPEQQDRS